MPDALRIELAVNQNEIQILQSFCWSSASRPTHSFIYPQRRLVSGWHLCNAQVIDATGVYEKCNMIESICDK